MSNFIDKRKEEELNIKDIAKLFGEYRWFIIFMMTISLLIASIYLFYTPSVYSTHAIIEVKSHDKSAGQNNDLLQNTFYASNTEINKEVEVLKTFNINKKVIEQMNFNSQIFFMDEYKNMRSMQRKLQLKLVISKLLTEIF